MLLLNVAELAAKHTLSYEEIHKALAVLYKLEYNPVAIKFFFDQAEFDSIAAEKLPGPKMTYCQALLASRMDDYIVKITNDKLLCDNARTVFGFRGMTEEEIKDHVKYTNDWDLAKQCLESKPKLPVGELKGIVAAPLYKTPVEPDVIFMIVNPFQAYHILNDYIGATKVPSVTSSHTINSAVCGGSVNCYLNGTAEMKTMCAGSFTSGKTEKGEVNIFIPGSQIAAVAKQLLTRSNQYGGGASFIGAGGQAYPGMDVCKKCPMIRFKDEEK
ncbi:DUF169 domain-containing protein [Desulforamulus ferrireducens]|uniref:DUF169 domain-containing protein n=1 Tax=Desulforamulus ferrireducens TaxID=1833852 RepID=A0A1S6IZE9_9FIRM|nr:DUF169 domain-containing protein [Desulforamulus ferrireducens]AQS60141.1 hypothetical protein B0537_14280 [Desulforamulus ferrireducens]